MVEPLIKNLLEAGVHFGHQTHRWNPKMKRFIFGAKNGIYVLDLEKTAKGLTEAREFLRSVAVHGDPILFVGTKKQAQPIIAEQAVRCGQYYVNLRWLGGLLTNFQTIRKSINRLKTLRAWREDGTFEKLTKKEVSRCQKELFQLERALFGIIEMDRLPKAIFLVDAKREETAIREAQRLAIPVVALVDTNSDPDPISFVIPGNDDAIRSIQMVTSLLADSILEGVEQYRAGQEAAAAEAAAKAAPPAVEPEPAPAPAEEQPIAEPPAAAEAADVIDEVVEQIVPVADLKTEVEGAVPPKKKRVIKAKIGPKTKEKE